MQLLLETQRILCVHDVTVSNMSLVFVSRQSINQEVSTLRAVPHLARDLARSRGQWSRDQSSWLDRIDEPNIDAS